MRKDDNYILRKIKHPSRMSIDLSLEEYKFRKLSSVYRYKDMGFSLSESISIVNGDISPDLVMVKKKRKNRNIILLFLLLFVVIVILGFYFLRFSPKSIDAIPADNVHKEVETNLSQDEVILFVGSDQRPEIDKGSGTSKDIPGVRTDVLMLVNIPKDGSKAIITSIPRDLNVYRPECYSYNYKNKKTHHSKTISAQNNVKINSIYENGGPECLVKTINNLTDQNITRYIQMDFDGFATIIDSIGGIEINTKSKVEDEILGTIVPNGGNHVLNGNKALDYARARHVIGTPMSDFDRIQRQQEVVNSVIKKINGSINPQMLSQIFTEVFPNMEVDNMNIDDILKIASNISGMNRENIFMNTLPTLEIENSYGNITYDEKEVYDYFSSINSQRPIYGQKIEDQNGYFANTMDSLPSSVTLIYTDKTEENKDKLKKYLSQKEIEVKSIKDSSFNYHNTTIYTNGLNSDEAATMMYVLQDSEISTEKINIKNKDNGSLVIVIGKNMSIQDIVPPGKIQIFIPIGVSLVKDILPVFLK